MYSISKANHCSATYTLLHVYSVHNTHSLSLSPLSLSLSRPPVGLGPTWHRYFCQYRKLEGGPRGKVKQMKFIPVGHHGLVRGREGGREGGRK